MKVAITGVSGFVGKNLTKVFTDYVAIHRDDTYDEIVAKLKDTDVVIKDVVVMDIHITTRLGNTVRHA